MRNLLLGLAAGLCAVQFAVGADRIGVVTGAQPPKLEEFAALQLSEQLRQLVDGVEIVASTTLPVDAAQLILVGSPRTNPAVGSVVGRSWPVTDEQTIVIKSFEHDGRQGVVLGGGSPAATLWAVYEFGRRQGIRYLLGGDSFPAENRPLELSGLDVTLRPIFRTRGLRTADDLPVGSAGWGIEDYKSLLGQLAKLKFNHLTLSVYPWQPFIEYELSGVPKQTSVKWQGRRYRVDGDTPGKKAFGLATYFENPDFAGRADGEPPTQAGIAQIQGVIDATHSLGMTFGISIAPFEFPQEFQALLPDAQLVSRSNGLSLLPGRMPGPSDPMLKEFVATKLRAYLKTYPAIDVLELRMSELPDWGDHAPQAWDELVARWSLNGWTLKTLLLKTAATSQEEAQIRNTVSALAFVRTVLDEPGLLERSGGSRVDVVLSGITPALSPILERLVPEESAVVHFSDESIPQIVADHHLLKKVGVDRVRNRLALNLQCQSAGLLPQSAFASLGTLMVVLKAQRWDGFVVSTWMPAEQDASVYYLARSAWDAGVTPDSAHKEFWTALTGSEAATDRLRQAWRHLEQATRLIDGHAVNVAFPGPEMMTQNDAPLPDWWDDLEEHYTQWMIELYRAHGASDSRGRPLLFYSAKRSEFALEYLTAVKEFRNALADREQKRVDAAVEHLAAAIESIYNAITAVADVARHQSDRGLIAMLNEFAYRPLITEFERLDELADD